MNWESKSRSQDELIRALDDERSDLCEHVQQVFPAQDGHETRVGPIMRDKAYGILKEDDSFGPVVRYVVCKACWEKAKQEQEEQKVHCNDCGQEKMAKDTISWKWYDFYAPQGDEPLTICTDCMVLPKHKQRVEKDNKDRRDEFGSEDEWDY